MAETKTLREMSPDEVAQLSPDQFKALADAHNDHLELRENARNRELAHSNGPANYPKMSPDADSSLRLMTDKELNQEIYRLESLVNHPDHEISPSDEKRLGHLLRIEEQRLGGSLGSELGDPNIEIDRILSGLTEPQERPDSVTPEPRKRVLDRILDRVKQAPENIRARGTDFSGLLNYEDKGNGKTKGKNRGRGGPSM